MSDTRFNVCYELIHKYTTSWGHKYSKHSVRELLQRCPLPLPLIPKPLLEKAPGRNLLQFKEQKYLKKRTDPLWSPKRQWLLQTSSWLKSKRKSSIKNVISLLVWKRYIDDIISRLLTNRHVFAMLENFVDYWILCPLKIAGRERF